VRLADFHGRAQTSQPRPLCAEAWAFPSLSSTKADCRAGPRSTADGFERGETEVERLQIGWALGLISQPEL